MAYPSTLDELTDRVPSDGAAPTTPLGDPTYPLDDWARAISVAVEAVEAELGTDPAGASATVAARLSALDTTVDAKVPASLVDAAGDLLVGSAADTLARLPLGTASQVLRVNAGATGLEYAAASSGAMSVIARTVLGSAASEVDFTSIPATYESLLIVWQAKTTGTGAIFSRLRFQLNGDTGSNYGWGHYYGSGASAGQRYSASSAGTYVDGFCLDTHASVAANWTAGGEILIPSYARTTFAKHGTGRYDFSYSLAQPAQGSMGFRWDSTAAVNRIRFFPDTGNFSTGSVFTLYGVAGA